LLTAAQRDFVTVRDKLRRHLQYPVGARRRGFEGNVRVSFVLGTDGCARQIRVETGSGHEELDAAVAEAVRRSSPFTLRPDNEIRLLFPVEFRLR
jgi:protein TonB